MKGRWPLQNAKSCMNSTFELFEALLDHIGHDLLQFCQNLKFLIFLRGGQSVIECSIFIVIDKILDSGFHIISFDVAAAADLGAESFRSPKFFATSLRISGVQEKRAVVVRLLLLAK